MRFLYSYLALPFYQSGLLLASFFSPKAKQWVQGRRGLMQHMQAQAPGDEPVVWFHCASLGEFEQGRPVIEAFRKEYPHHRILLTFFSPSGYQVRKDYPGADYVFYMPLDTPGNVRQFLDTWNPAMAVFVKYEFWFNYIGQLSERDIPVLVISAIFRPQQHFFRPWGGWFRRQLKKISWFFVQNEASLQLLRSQGLQNASVSGDTRFDRVYQIRQAPVGYPILEEFSRGHQVVVAGSTWPADEQLLLPLINQGRKGLRFVIAPHEIHHDHIRQLQSQIKVPSVAWSQVGEQIPPQAGVLIIDRIGMLSQLYQYGTVAYIGGGFGRGIHNILEAATFGLPVFFGPEYGKFAEANDLVRAGGAFPVRDDAALQHQLDALLNDPGLLEKASATCSHYVQQKQGATALIMDYIHDLSDQRQRAQKKK